jgi:hypothetical protein
MQYTRPMIDLVYEIRRRVDAELKPGIKLANPEMLKELADYYQRTKDTVSKALIKELLHQAGEEWLALITPPRPEVTSTTTTRQMVKVYRGQTMLVETAAPATETHEAPQRPLRMYRGHPVI